MSERACLQGTAIAWMRKQDWPRWLELDSQFQPNYNHWLRWVEGAFAQYRPAGVPVLKVIIEPDEFLAWGKANGKGMGTMDRAAFAVWKMRQADDQEKPI